MEIAFQPIRASLPRAGPRARPGPTRRAAPGKPLLVGEIETVPGDPRSPRWFRRAAALFRSWGDVVAIEWSLRTLYSPLSSPGMLAAWLAASARTSS